MGAFFKAASDATPTNDKNITLVCSQQVYRAPAILVLLPGESV